MVYTWKARGSVYTQLKPSCGPQCIWAVSSVHVFVGTVQSYHQGLPAGGTPSSWPPASPSPAAPGEHPAAPPRVSLPPAHHAQGRDTIHTEAPPLKRKGRHRGAWGKGRALHCSAAVTASLLALKLICSQPTCQRFLLCQLRSVILRFPLVLRLIMDCLLFRGVIGLGDNILLFGGMRRAGWAEAETDGGHRQIWVCVHLLPNEWQ